MRKSPRDPAVKILKAIAQPTRLVILHILSKDERPISFKKLIADCGLPKATLSSHLSILERARLIDRTTDRGRQVEVSLRLSRLKEIAEFITKIYVRASDARGVDLAKRPAASRTGK